MYLSLIIQLLKLFKYLEYILGRFWKEIYIKHLPDIKGLCGEHNKENDTTLNTFSIAL
jgi:hypothetical protein